MKKETELAPSELWANHLLKRIIKGPGPAKIIFKKKSSRKGKHWGARTEMKLVQITFSVMGERQNKPPPQPTGKPHKTDWSGSPPRSHLLTAFFLQCFNLKKEEKREKGKKEKEEKEKKKTYPLLAPYSSFIQSHSLCINYHRLPVQGRRTKASCFQRGSLPPLLFICRAWWKFHPNTLRSPPNFCIL